MANAIINPLPGIESVIAGVNDVASGQGDRPTASGLAAPEQAAVNAAQNQATNPFGFSWPTLENLRSLMVRVVKVIGGLILMFVGLDQLAGKNTTITLASSIKDAVKMGAVAA